MNSSSHRQKINDGLQSRAVSNTRICNETKTFITLLGCFASWSHPKDWRIIFGERSVYQSKGKTFSSRPRSFFSFPTTSTRVLSNKSVLNQESCKKPNKEAGNGFMSVWRLIHLTRDRMGWERVSGVERSDHRRMRRERERGRTGSCGFCLSVCLSVCPSSSLFDVEAASWPCLRIECWHKKERDGAIRNFMMRLFDMSLATLQIPNLCQMEADIRARKYTVCPTSRTSNKKLLSPNEPNLYQLTFS